MAHWIGFQGINAPDLVLDADQIESYADMYKNRAETISDGKMPVRKGNYPIEIVMKSGWVHHVWSTTALLDDLFGSEITTLDLR